MISLRQTQQHGVGFHRTESGRHQQRLQSEANRLRDRDLNKRLQTQQIDQRAPLRLQTKRMRQRRSLVPVSVHNVPDEIQATLLDGVGEQ